MTLKHVIIKHLLSKCLPLCRGGQRRRVLPANSEVYEHFWLAGTDRTIPVGMVIP